jgi:hypothetical protein
MMLKVLMLELAAKNTTGLKGRLNQIRIAWDHSTSLVLLHKNVFFVFFAMELLPELSILADSRLHTKRGCKYYQCLFKKISVRR